MSSNRDLVYLDEVQGGNGRWMWRYCIRVNGTGHWSSQSWVTKRIAIKHAQEVASRLGLRLVTPDRS